MPPSRSTKDSVRFTPSASRPHRARVTQSTEVIDISSEEDDNDDEVIVISSDDDSDAHAKVVSQNTKKSKKPTPVSRISTHKTRGTPKTRATPKKCAAPASMKHRPVTVARIIAGDFGDPRTWTFGLPEANFVDMDKLVEDSRPFMTDLPEAEWVASLRALNPKAHGAHPDKNDRTVRYTHVERYPGGPIWFTIRWWDGRDFGNFFDLVDVATQKLFLPHRDLPDLFVQVEFLGGMMPVCTMEEAARRSRGVKKIPGGTDDERYNAPAGARTLFSRVLPNGKRVPVADVYSPRYRRPAPLGPQPPTLSPFDP